jgi:DNA-binding XRE family transcriptional regulator
MLAQFIEKLRKQHNLTQGFVALEIGVSRPTYIQIERGERDLTIPEAQKIVKLFNLTIDDLLNQKITSYKVDLEKEVLKKVKDKDEEIRISVPQEKVEKFKQVLLYILRKVGGKPNVGMTVLYKLLYFIDFDYYEKYEEQLMGLTYIKNHYGPTPVIFEKVVEEMIKADVIEIIKSKYYQHNQKKYLVNPKIEPDLSILTGQEMEHIDWELNRLSDFTASALSDLSHRDVPWIGANLNKPLDYEAVFYRTDMTSVRMYEDEPD